MITGALLQFFRTRQVPDMFKLNITRSRVPDVVPSLSRKSADTAEAKVDLSSKVDGGKM